MDQLDQVRAAPPNTNLESQAPRPTNGDENSILFIGRDPTLLGCKAQVLMKAGFRVSAASPVKAKAMLATAGCYGLVVLSHTLLPEEVLEVVMETRARHARTKMLFVLGPDPVSFSLSIFDATVEGLDGPTALIHMATKLLASAESKASGYTAH